ncbi:MAG: FkbM family methyltransferase [Chloroflexota bacterium]
MPSLVLTLAALASRLLPMPLKQAAYRLGPLTRLLRRALNRAAPTGLTEVSVTAGGLRGARLLLDLQSEKDLWLGTYEPELQAALREFAPAGATAFDVGAHIGYVSLLLARAVAPGGQVFAFEPLPTNLDRLSRHIQLNQLADRLHVVPAAVSDKSGRTRFLVHASGSMGKVEGSAGRADTYARHLEVDCLSLDDFVYSQGHPAPDLVKIDIEGGEGLALMGMRHLLAERPPVLLIELHGPEAAVHVWQTIGAHGYRLHRLQRGYPAVEDVRELPWKAYVIALPRGFERGRR